MTTISHEPVHEERALSARVLGPELWAAVAIVVMWVAVLVVAIYGPDIVTSNGVSDVGSSTTIPSVVVVAPFAFLGTWVVARRGFGGGREE